MDLVIKASSRSAQRGNRHKFFPCITISDRLMRDYRIVLKSLGAFPTRHSAKSAAEAYISEHGTDRFVAEWREAWAA